MLDQDPRNTSFTRTANNSELVANFHLENSTIRKTESNKIVLDLLG